MAQLTANAIQIYEVGETNSLPIKASTEIFLGSAVGLTAGYARQLVAADVFAGFADAHVNNTVATDGAATIPVRQSGLIQLAITSAAVTDIGKPVYASDGNTYTLTSTSNSRIGTIVRWVSTGVVVVKFSATPARAITAIVDSTGGTASTTFAAITAAGTYAQADIVAIKNALAQIALTLNSFN